MRIGFVTGEYPPMEGGVGAYTRELARALAQDGHEVHIHTRRAASDSSEAAPGVVVQATIPRWGWKTPRDVRAWAEVNRLDVVDIQFQTAAFNMHPAIHLLPRLIESIPVVVTFHDLRAPYLFPKAGPLRQRSVRFLASTADLAIATDRQDENMLRNEWHVEHATRIPIGSNINAEPIAGYNREDWRASLDVGPDDLLIGYFGFLNPTKGGRELVEALELIRKAGVDAHLLMIGGKVGASDPTNAAYGELVEETITQLGLKENVLWTGFADDATVSGHFLASDIVALPYEDGASLRRGTLMAALAHGCAIVTTTPAIPAPELMDNASVALIPAPPDPKLLADAILHVWHSPDERARLQQAAQEASAYFTWDAIARRTLDEFAGLTGKSV